MGIDAEWLRDTLTRIDQKVDDVREDQATQRAESARELGALNQSVQAAHVRLDRHEEGHKSNLSLWIGSIIGLSGVVVAAVALFLKSG